jgi:S-adenosylmethionine:tRNA ribosyltransferase-isomerase
MKKNLASLRQYAYTFPEECIAQAPASPRDAARLLVFDRKKTTTSLDTFRNLARYLPPKSVIVFNRTKVIPARFWCRKESGGKVQVLYIRHDTQFVYALCNRKLTIGTHILLTPTLRFLVHGRVGTQYILKPSFGMSRMMALLNRYGTTPIPPYIKHSPLSERALRREYQAIFAKTQGSVAAPTASLHFTPRLLASLKKAGHTIFFVTLHVGLGTFAPLTTQQLTRGRLHEECFDIDVRTARALTLAKKSGKPVVAVGTTVARALESASDAKGRLVKLRGMTDIFIREGYVWRFVDSLITNFHVPKSSLMMLVASLVGRARLLKLYRYALSQRMRFFSFGDGMLIR